MPPSASFLSTPPTLASWQASGRWFRYAGRRVFYREAGAGPALVCIHGFPTASWDWHRLWPALTERFRVVAPDLPGFGFSDKPRAPYRLADQTTVVEALLADRGVEAAHVLAHDYGDTVVQEWLARQAAEQARVRLRSACLLNGGLFPEATRPRLIQHLLRQPLLGPLLARGLTERRFRRSFAAVFGPGTRPTDAELRDFWTLVTHHDGTRVVHRVIQYMAERRRHRARWVGALQRSPVPLRLIIGRHDPVSGLPTAARYRALVPAPDVVVLDDAGHYPQLEAPDAVLAAFLAFVARVDASPSVKSP